MRRAILQRRLQTRVPLTPVVVATTTEATLECWIDNISKYLHFVSWQCLLAVRGTSSSFELTCMHMAKDHDSCFVHLRARFVQQPLLLNTRLL
jgi:predicted Na+-dependent transporter